MSSPTSPSDETIITKIKANRLDQIIQILEISFIFMICYSIITLVDAAFLELNLYNPLGDFLGDEGIGNLNGGHFEEIVRVTLIFNLLLFSVSLIFGLWMRRARDGWSFSQLGYTLKTPNYSFGSLVRRGLLLGFIVILVWYTLVTFVQFLLIGDLQEAIFMHHSFQSNGTLLDSHQLLAEYYFGFIEMGFIWPLSAGFFFFAYVHNSLKARFPFGIANLLATFFYVTYLAFFFMIPSRGKFDFIIPAIKDPMFWAMLMSFAVVLYISFSAFAETGSVVLPFLLNFVLNVGLTLFKSINSLLFNSSPELDYFWMIIPYLVVLTIIVIWYFLKREDFSTLRLGLGHIREIFTKKSRNEVSLRAALGIFGLFFTLSFIVPGFIEYIVSKRIGQPDLFPTELVSLVYALTYVVIIGLAIIVLTYEPTEVFDVLLVKMPDGIPIAQRLKLFQSDEVLISGFFTAISSVSKELDEDEKADLRSIKRGEREIILEDGVFTRIIALVDRDQNRIRQMMQDMLRKFESANSTALANWIGDVNAIPEAKTLVKEMGRLSIRFDIPNQTRLIGVLTVLLTPLMITLIGFI
ncbi:MAG: hypothetical protein ACW97Z_13475 [Candidatus Hodarchaeales archaeon]|jgi:hypothetical protein